MLEGLRGGSVKEKGEGGRAKNWERAQQEKEEGGTGRDREKAWKERQEVGDRDELGWGLARGQEGNLERHARFPAVRAAERTLRTPAPFVLLELHAKTQSRGPLAPHIRNQGKFSARWAWKNSE